MFSGLEWDFPTSEVARFVADNFQLIMPLLLLIVGVLLALLVLDGLIAALLKIVGFLIGRSQTRGLDDDDG